MIKIGLLSDTHGFIDDKIINFFAEVDEIWHAGDIGSLKLGEYLEGIKPLRAVHGNIDNHEIRMAYPQIQKFETEEVKVLMTHIGGYPGRYESSIISTLKSFQPRLFIAGHSHILKIMYDKKFGLLHINPGAAGKNGFHQVRTAVRFEIDSREIKNPEVLELKR